MTILYTIERLGDWSMLILLDKYDIIYIPWAAEQIEEKKLKKTEKVIKTIYKNKDKQWLKIDVNKQNIYDIYDCIRSYTGENRMDDIHIYQVENKFKQFIDDIENNKRGWDKDKTQVLREI